MGIFISFEGCDGSGKTTVSKSVYDRLLKENYDVIYTREPGGIDIAEQIRNVILDKNNTKMDRKTEAILFAASRRQHLVERIIPALKDNKIIICDRFVDSSLAYQGFARGLGIEEVYNLNKFAIDDYMPVKTLYLDVDPLVGLSRIESRCNKDRLDVETIEFHKSVYEGYKIVLDMFKDRIIKIDANIDLDSIIDNCYNEVVKIINDKR